MTLYRGAISEQRSLAVLLGIERYGQRVRDFDLCGVDILNPVE